MDAKLVQVLLEISDPISQNNWLKDHAPSVDRALIQQLQQEARQRERQNPHRALEMAQLVRRVGDFWQDQQTTAVSLHIEADARRLLFEHNIALKLYKEATAIYQNLDLELDAAYVAVGQIATMKYLGEYEEAIALSHWVSDVLQVANDQSVLGKIVMNRGNIFARQRRLGEALASFTEARTIFENSEDQHHLALVNANIGVTHMLMDNFRQAEKVFRQVRTYFRQQNHENMVAQIDHNIAHLNMAQGNYQKALVIFNSSRELFLIQENFVEVASIDLMRSDIYLALNLWEEALEVTQSARQTFEEANMSWELGRLYLNEAAALAHINPKETPLEPLTQARHLFTREENQVWLAMTDLYQATFDWRKGDLATAAQMAQDASIIFQENGFRSRAAQCDIIVGEVALLKNEYLKAAECFKQGIKHLQKSDIPAVSFACLFGLGRTHQYQGDYEEALTYYRRAIADIERLQAAIGAEDYKIAFLSDKLDVYQAMVLLCFDLKTAVTEKEAFETVERAKSRTLLDSLAREKSVKTTSAAEADLRADITRLKNELNWYYNRLNQPQIDTDTPATLEDLRTSVTRRERALNQRLKKWRSPDLAAIPRNPIWTITLEKIQSVLPDNTILLEYYTTSDEVVVFGITATQIWSRRLTTPISQINEHLSEFRFQINKFSYGATYQQKHEVALRRSTDDSLFKLYQALIAPIADHITVDTLIVVPHGLLHYIPFHAMFDGESYLLDRKTISYAPSATILYHTLTAKKRKKTGAPIILGLADETIPQAENEAKAISSLFPEAEVRLREDATLGADETCTLPPAFIHLSTHATFRADNPLFSAVKLSDRWLSVNEIYGMDAPVPLITLSACETGRNQILVGDELVGLCRGLFAAGADSLVVSLWMVDDSSTTQLMTHFYQGLQEGLSVNQALRNAQLATKSKGTDDDHRALSHPYYWAPFILTGSMQSHII